MIKEHSSFFAKGLRSKNSSVIIIFSISEKIGRGKRQNEKAQFKSEVINSTGNMKANSQLSIFLSNFTFSDTH